MAAVTAVLSQIIIPIGPVPINLAVLGAFLTGFLLPPLWAAASLIVYMAMGAVGIPVFAGFQGGIAVLLNQTGGYVVGYVFTALFTSLGNKSGKFFLTAAGMAVGLLICYAIGTIWFMTVTGNGLAASLSVCVIPFIPFDILKGVCAYFAGKAVNRQLKLSKQN